MNSNSTDTQHPMTTVFNLIILDESGSMSHVADRTIAGCNETLNVVRYSAQTHKDKMRNLVSIYAFQDGGPVKSRYLVKNARPEDVTDITPDDYQPWGNTPLFDAVGSTLSELRAVAATHEDATGIITIITDGYENSSRHYNGRDIAAMIESFKEMGWTINLIGANIDVEALGRQMNIDNNMAFQSTCQGTSQMFSDFSRASRIRMTEMAEECAMTKDQRLEERKKKSKGFFSR